MGKRHRFLNSYFPVHYRDSTNFYFFNTNTERLHGVQLLTKFTPKFGFFLCLQGSLTDFGSVDLNILDDSWNREVNWVYCLDITEVFTYIQVHMRGDVVYGSSYNY